MKKKLFAVPALCLSLLFALCACKADFVGNKIKVGNSYTLSFSVLNTTEKETLNLKKGQVLKVSLSIEKGTVSLNVAQSKSAPIYRGTDLDESASFSVTVPEDGKYTVLVSGKDAKGKVKFEVTENEMV